MAKERTIKNVGEVRDRLEVLFLNMENGHVKALDAKEMANVAGKMLASAKLQLEYAALRKEKPVIQFLEAK